ncbi:hypothetical protein [Kushneria aurantia]|uniref:Uncharacterized protein n=1 Tax=Kushneria aurantia TaxID=504092 RepID=A0ABV6G4S6_9GAMM|nr:hypothetical protein [Kushneria aurantia]
MKLNKTSRIIGDDENNIRLIKVLDGDTEDSAEVKAFGELSAEVVEGEMAGRTIQAFAWLEKAPQGHEINVTEKRSGMRLVRIPVLTDQGEWFQLDDALFNKMLPTLMEGCKTAAFHRFQEASEERLAEMFRHMDKTPPLEHSA